MPTLPPLVTPLDMAAYGYEQVSDAILARASARVRRFLRQQITAGSSVIVVQGPGPWLLPQRPVNVVTSVVNRQGNPVAWELIGPRLQAAECAPLTVGYTHGWPIEELPDDLTELVCAIAARLAQTPSTVGAGARTEQAGGESVTWGVEAFSAGSGLTPAEEGSLRHIYPTLPSTIYLI